ALASLIVGIVCLAGSIAFSQELSELSLPPGGNGVSQRAEVSQWIGLVKVSIAYHSPSVHRGAIDRTGHIWGEMIPFGLFDDGRGPSTATPWRAGANENTTITFSHDVKIQGHDLKAGTYALFLELAEAGPWTWIFSTHATGWGSYQYDPRHDALRVPVQDQQAPFTEFLTYGFDARRGDSAVAYLQWENRRVPFEIAVPNVNELYVDRMREELQGWPGFNSQNWQTAAQFCADHRLNLEEALVWADKAIREPFRGATVGSVEFSTLRTKAAVLEAMGRDREAEPIMQQALQLPDTPALILNAYGSSLLASGKSQRALDVFKLNQRRHPDEPFWTYLGLARGFTAVGDRASAIKNWETALRHVPDSQKTNVSAFEQALRALNSGR
ncbi:MAG TPA: DUF2911 domain-containing protein, partial [Vicinamibacterales bacterium]|nr:DUF2911 domain-containing protein [Vicinamibacterales bacterium]